MFLLFIPLAFLAYKMFAGNNVADPMSLKQQIVDAINTMITLPLGLNPKATDILYFQGVKETGNYEAWYFAGEQPDGLPPTYNIFNRRVGTGKGEWTSQIKMINGDDTRIYTDVYQSARDMKQRLTQYGDMTTALDSLRRGDGVEYFMDLEKIGYSARSGDYLAYADQWQKEYA